MNIDFEDDELRKLYEDPDCRPQRFHPNLIKAYRKKVGILVAAASEFDLWNMRSLNFEKLLGDREGHHSIRLNDQWRLILRIESSPDGKLVLIIEIVDYH